MEWICSFMATKTWKVPKYYCISAHYERKIHSITLEPTPLLRKQPIR